VVAKGGGTVRTSQTPEIQSTVESEELHSQRLKPMYSLSRACWAGFSRLGPSVSRDPSNDGLENTEAIIVDESEEREESLSKLAVESATLFDQLQRAVECFVLAGPEKRGSHLVLEVIHRT
jgi:hypothetical protein